MIKLRAYETTSGQIVRINPVYVTHLISIDEMNTIVNFTDGKAVAIKLPIEVLSQDFQK